MRRKVEEAATKCCLGCREVLPNDYTHFNPNTNRCRRCQSAYVRERYHARHPGARTYDKSKYRRQPEWTTGQPRRPVIAGDDWDFSSLAGALG